MKLLVIDGNSILNRAFYGIRLLTTKDGRYTNAIYGFLTTLNKMIEDVNPDRYAVAFDLKKPTFRHNEYSGYKAQRKGMPEELAQQLPVLKELLKYLGYVIVECEGYEADDILGTLAHECEKTENECIIATGDRDSLQLVSNNVTVRLTTTKMGKPQVTFYDVEKIKEVYNVEPKQLIDIKAIQGDTSDNIPGVKGIGQKGASDLITRFKNLDYIYENIETLDIKEGMRTKLKADKEKAYLSRFLGEISTKAPIDIELSHYEKNQVDKEKATRLMIELELFSLIEKMGLQKSDIKPLEINKEKVKDVSIKKASDVIQLIEKIKSDKKAMFLTQIEQDDILEIAFYIDDCVIYLQKIDDVDMFDNLIKSVFEDDNIIKQTYNLKSLYKILEKKEIFLNNANFDIMLAGYLLNPSAANYEYSRLVDEYCITDNKICDDTLSDCVKNTVHISNLINILNTKIKENNQEKLLNDIEIPLAKVLSQMENTGFLIDAQGIRNYASILGEKLEELETKIYDEVSYKFNINSPKQLGIALFEDLQLPKGKKTKTGYSTSADVLENLQYDYPVVKNILEYRAISKLISTFCDGMIKVIGADGRIHTNFNQTETRTGRISSTEPNLQNIPVRTAQGRELRKYFCAKEGCVLIDADYSQIELRVLAHIANDKVMINAFENNEDIHTITASQVFNLPVEMINSNLRSKAKAVNFGIVYGIGAFSLAKDIKVTRKEAQNYIDSYLHHYSGVDNYMDYVVTKATENGYVETLYGRKRYLPELSSSNFNMRSFGQRVARNMPIQGTSADIIKIAMIKVYNRLLKENLKAKLILQVHDELIVEAPNEEALRVATIVQEEMENAVDLKVKLRADSSIGKSWYDAKG